MKKNMWHKAILLYSSLMLGLSPLAYVAQSKPAPVEVSVVKFPDKMPESALSKAAAEFIDFLMNGMRGVWNRYFAIQEAETKLAQGGGVDKLRALQLAAFRGILLATPALMGILMIKGSKIGMKYLKNRVVSVKPTILNNAQQPFFGRTDRIRRWLFGQELQQMIFNDGIADRLMEIEKKTSMLQEMIKAGKKRHYANLLLYGKPGTGKTLFTQQLAYQNNMDFFPVTAASLLQEGVKGIKYFDELIATANKSSYGVIIFIDEADGLLLDRDSINPDSDHYKVLEHILSIIDGRSEKYMIVAATNHEYLLDAAMNRRFQDHICMPLPDMFARKKLLALYATQFLFNVQETSKQFVRAAKQLLTVDVISDIATKVAGLSHAEIADMIEAMRSKAELNQRLIMQVDVESAIQEAMAKQKKKIKNEKVDEA
jgi:AAA+ superfamily predicted ATPase